MTVAVVDTGVAPHPDLRRNLLQGTNVLPGSTSNGQDDENGHGTSMAGIIAAHGRGLNDGILGIAPEAKILPVKDQEPGNTGGSRSIAAGISWAATNGAKVINVSAASAPTVSLQTALEEAAASDAVVVAGAGNRPDHLQVGSPAAMTGVLAVGAVDRSARHASFSVRGQQIQLCAPGVEMESTRLNGRYYRSTGTSPATAIVSGAAALVRAKFPDLSAQQVIERLTSTATDIGAPGRDDQCGYGLLNIVAALTADTPASTTPPTEPPPTTTPTGPAPTTPQAQPEPAGSNTPLVAGGIITALAAAGALAFAATKRRRRNNG